jgi:hypothetical protein
MRAFVMQGFGASDQAGRALGKLVIEIADLH